MINKILCWIGYIIIGILLFNTVRFFYATIDRDMIPRDDVVALVFVAFFSGLIWGVLHGQKKAN